MIQMCLYYLVGIYSKKQQQKPTKKKPRQKKPHKN